VPPLELLIGRSDVVWGPNFVVPPVRRGSAVVTVNDLTPLRFPELCTADTLAYPALVVAAVRRGAWVHTLTGAVGEEVRNWLPAAADRVVTVPLGVTPPHGGDPVRGRRAAGADRYVLAISTVEPRKGFPTLVAAFDAVAAEFPDAALVVAGPDGWGIEGFEAARAAARHRDRVRRLGWVDQATRADLLAGAALFAAPSLYEGFGLPAADALAAGIPVVTSDDPALVEVTGDAALHVPVGDAGALADALRALLGDPGGAAALAARGPGQVAGFTWDATAAGLSALFQRARR
jgi:glycosyltransferase involved in cell wall biosynthesis